MSFALLFSGQGTQHAAMLPWLDDAAPLVQATRSALGLADWRAALQDEAWAPSNRHAQPLLTGLALAAWQQLSPALPAPLAVAGYSVGELAAYSAAGVFSAATALQLAGQRAEAMDHCARQQPGGLASVSGLPRAALTALLAAPDAAPLHLAIDIDPHSAVLGGPVPALQGLVQRAEAAGARAGLLRVRVASHTPSMQPAADAMAALLAPLVAAHTLVAPQLPLWCNATAEQVQGAAQAAALLAQQTAQTVRWAEVLQAVHDRRPRCVLEIGPGQALAAMWNRRFPDVPARSVDEFRSAGAVCQWVLRSLG
jgi:[acyl-carrier-protein] S-malonyltransferase